MPAEREEQNTARNWIGQMKKICLFLILIVVFQSKANVGGTFYKRAVSGLSVDSGATIVNSSTEITCNDTVCGFRSVYRTSSASVRFKGRFYGVRFSNIRINGVPFLVDSSLIDSLPSDSELFGRRFVLEQYIWGAKLLSIPVDADVQPDSTIVVEGDLEPQASENWGLAAYPNMVSLRHFLLQRPKLHNNEYSLAYVLAPIQSFDGLKSARLRMSGKNIELLKRTTHRQMIEADIRELDSIQQVWARRSPTDKDSVAKLDGSVDSVEYFHLIPDAIEYRFKLKDKKAKALPFVSPGGPVLFIGGRRKKFHSEIGWEASINPIDYLAIMPSAFAAFNTQGYMDWSIGLRGYFMGFSLGFIAREFKTFEFTIGVDMFGVVGIEGRNNAFLGKLSI